MIGYAIQAVYSDGEIYDGEIHSFPDNPGKKVVNFICKIRSCIRLVFLRFCSMNSISEAIYRFALIITTEINSFMTVFVVLY